MPFIRNLKNYTDRQIDDALRMKNQSRRVSFRYELLDRHDVKIGTLDGVQSASVQHNEFSVIKRTASFSLNEYLQREIDFFSDEISPWLILHMPDGGTVEWQLGIFLLGSPGRAFDGNLTAREISGYDKTLILEEDKFEERHFIAAGTNYIGAINEILSRSNITKINIAESGLSLNADREFAVGTKISEAVNTLLQEINYNTIRVDESGFMRSEPYVEPFLRPITQRYSSKTDSITLPKYSEAVDITGKDNVFIFVAKNVDGGGELSSTFVNDDPLSGLSTVNRGRRLVRYEEIDDVANQDVLDDYARRVAIESTSAYSRFTFNTALMPHGSGETLYIDMPEFFGVPLKFSETSWSMDPASLTTRFINGGSARTRTAAL